MTYVKFLLFFFFAFNFSALSGQQDSTVILIEEDNIEMVNAFAEAKETLGDFIERATIDRSEDEIYGAYIKVVQEEIVEYLWVSDFQKYDEVDFVGVLITEPELTSLYTYGTTIGFKISDIYDWQIYNKNNDVTEGAYTFKALKKDD